MFKFPKLIAALALALLAGSALAAPLVLGSVGKTYGSATGQTANDASNSRCVKSGSVTVSDSSSGCGTRFSDSFDFSGIAGASVSISSLQLALSFSGTDDVFAFLWFADEALGANRFSLVSARLDVVGVIGVTSVNTVPEPSVLALIAVAVLSVVWSRRRAAAPRPWVMAGRS